MSDLGRPETPDDDPDRPESSSATNEAAIRLIIEDLDRFMEVTRAVHSMIGAWLDDADRIQRDRRQLGF